MNMSTKEFYMAIACFSFFLIVVWLTTIWPVITAIDRLVILTMLIVSFGCGIHGSYRWYKLTIQKNGSVKHE